MKENGRKWMRNLLKLLDVKKIIFALRIILPMLCVLVLVFIFSQSLQTGEQSAQTSSKVVDTVQEVAQVIAPESKIATATGEAYDKLHADIRTLAHFAEFVLLGAVACGCCLVYTQKKRYWLLGILGLVLVPIIDETLQSFTANRAAEIIDILVDFGGGIVGFALVLGCFYGVAYWWKRRKNKRETVAQNT